MSDYARYVFRGQHMALVYSDEERAKLPGWTDAPSAEFTAPVVAHFDGFAQVPEELRGELEEVEEKDGGNDGEEVAKPLTVFEKAELKKAAAAKKKAE